MDKKQFWDRYKPNGTWNIMLGDLYEHFIADLDLVIENHAKEKHEGWLRDIIKNVREVEKDIGDGKDVSNKEIM